MPTKESITPSYSKPDFNNPTTAQIRFIRKKEVMYRTGLSSTGIYDLINRGLFPKQITLAGGKSVAWLESDIEQWLKQCLDNSTSQGAA
ncbi:MAG: AlpA family transcriptional regulator [Pseudomonadales bacterium]|nr:AlpA family transcriptional regulator [Pseudomonadales bacterium]